MECGTQSGNCPIDELGLKPEERYAFDLLRKGAEAFYELEPQHPDEMRNFTDALHRLQDLFALRAMRRAFPAGWKTYDLTRDQEGN